MEFIFLGTSAGTPTRHRNVSGLALRLRGARSWNLVDCGEGCQHQILRTALSLHRLQNIFITHVHGDHCYGLPGLLATAAITGRTDPLRIVAPPAIGTMLAEIQRASALRLPYELIHVPVDALAQPLQLDDFVVEPVALSHRVASYGYVFTERRVEATLDTEKLLHDGIPAGPIWGRIHKRVATVTEDGRPIEAGDYLITRRSPRVLAVCGDNDRPATLASLNPQPDVVIHEATYTVDVADRVGPGPGHSTARAVAEYAQAATLRHLVLTHFSPRYSYRRDTSPTIRDLEDEARNFYSGSLFLANDFDHFHLDRDRNLVRLDNGKAVPGIARQPND